MRPSWLCGLGLFVSATSFAAEEVPQLDTIVVIGNYSKAVGSSDAASQGVVTLIFYTLRPFLKVIPRGYWVCGERGSKRSVTPCAK